ncbi:MAG TPA: cation transporter [Drouetiella sp.]|jgi:copper chaperone CopZ
MTKEKLTEKHGAVVHRSKHRTRLRVPKGKLRNEHDLLEVKNAIQKIDGVRHVEVNPQTGSVLVHHEDKHDILTDIGAAIEESAPELLMALVMPAAAEEAGVELLTRMFRKYFMTPRADQIPNGGNGGVEHEVNGGARFELRIREGYARTVNKKNAKNIVPLAFVVAGAVKLVRDESLWANVPALALFYWGFDMYWKLQQTEELQNVESVLGERSEGEG